MVKHNKLPNVDYTKKLINPCSLEDLDEFFSCRNKKPEKGKSTGIAHASVFKEKDCFVIRYYHTDILRYMFNGDIHICCGDLGFWNFCLDIINYYLPKGFFLQRVRDSLYVSLPKDRVDFDYVNGYIIKVTMLYKAFISA